MKSTQSTALLCFLLMNSVKISALLAPVASDMNSCVASIKSSISLSPSVLAFDRNDIRRSNGRFGTCRSATRRSKIRTPDSLSQSGNSDIPHGTNEILLVDPRVNQERKAGAIDCEHFGKCPGCSVNDHVTNVDILRSAQSYFSSAAIRNHCMESARGHTDGGGRSSRSSLDKQHRSMSSEESFFEIIVPSPLVQWRTQAKLAVAPKSSWGRDGCIFGLYERGSHRVMSIPNCEVHHPSINRAIRILEQATKNVGTAAYREDVAEGELRYVQLQVERSTGKVCCTLVWKAANLKGCQPGLTRLIKESRKLDSELWHSFWCHTNDSFGNSIFVRGMGRWHLMFGPEFVKEPLPVAGSKGLLYFTPIAFRQANMDGFDKVAMHVAKAIPGGSKVCELYAGVGLLGLTALAYHAQGENENDAVNDRRTGSTIGQNGGSRTTPLQWVRCSDENPANSRCFDRAVSSMSPQVTGKETWSHRNQKRTSISGRTFDGKRRTSQSNEEITMKQLVQNMVNTKAPSSDVVHDGSKGKITYSVASAASALHEGQALAADVLVVDPPRKGLEEEVLLQLSKPFNPNQDYVVDPLLIHGPRHAINWVNDVHTLIYVSCGFDALARDCDRILYGNAGWKLESVTGYILFPGSNHVEIVAVFKRQQKKR